MTRIAFHRSTSVIVGVMWSAVVSRYWWPFTARRELRMGLSEWVVNLLQGIADLALVSVSTCHTSIRSWSRRTV